MHAAAVSAIFDYYVAYLDLRAFALLVNFDALVFHAGLKRRLIFCL